MYLVSISEHCVRCFLPRSSFAIKKLVIFSACVSRFDPDGAGAVKTNHFLKVLGLDESGVPRPSTTPRYISMGNACVVKNSSELEKVNIFS